MATATLPWVECPTLDLDLDLPPEERYAAMPEQALEAGRQLLAAVIASVPAKLHVLADLARLRTGNRFHAELKGMGDAAGVSWRSLLIANLSYDLVLATFGCSTMALATPDGPVLARNMDWW